MIKLFHTTCNAHVHYTEKSCQIFILCTFSSFRSLFLLLQQFPFLPFRFNEPLWLNELWFILSLRIAKPTALTDCLIPSPWTSRLWCQDYQKAKYCRCIIIKSFEWMTIPPPFISFSSSSSRKNCKSGNAYLFDAIIKYNLKQELLYNKKKLFKG